MLATIYNSIHAGSRIVEYSDSDSYWHPWRSIIYTLAELIMALTEDTLLQLRSVHSLIHWNILHFEFNINNKYFKYKYDNSEPFVWVELQNEWTAPIANVFFSKSG